MKTKITIVAAALASASCGPPASFSNFGSQDSNVADVEMNDTMLPVEPPPPVRTVRNMLTEGDGKACSDNDIRDTVSRALTPKIAPTAYVTSADIQAGQAAVTYSLDLIALASVDRSISSVSCDANVTIHTVGFEDRSFSVRYTIRPSVEDDYSWIINTNSEAAPYARNMVWGAINNVVLRRQARTRPAPLPSVPEPDRYTDLNVSEE